MVANGGEVVEWCNDGIVLKCWNERFRRDVISTLGSWVKLRMNGV